MKKFIFPIILYISFSAKGQLGNYNQDGEVKILSQKTWATIAYKETELKSDKEAAGAIAGAILAPLIDVGISAIKEKMKQNVLKYTSNFVVSVSGSGFWISEKKVNLPILTINRNIIKKGETPETNAMTIILNPELSPDKTAFRFITDKKFVYAYSSAKTKKEYDFIDVKIEIKLKALIVTKSQYELKDLRATSISIPMIKAGTSQLPADVSLTSGWIPFPSMPTLEIETDVTEQDTKTVTIKGTKDGKPIDEALTTTTRSLKQKSVDKEKVSQNSGLYEFEITVTETNPYKVKIENTQKLVEGTSESSSTLLKAIIDAIFKKEDKKDEEGADK